MSSTENPFAHVRGPCCPPESIPFLPEDPNYVPHGQMIAYDNVNAYTVGEGTKALIFIHDIFGLPNGLNKYICDKFSEGLPGYTIIAPDFFPDGLILGNDPLLERGSSLLSKILWTICTCKIWGYLAKNSWDNVAGDIFNKTTTYLYQKGVTDICLEGNCWGAYIVFKACNAADHKHLFRACISAHPSLHSLASIYKEDAMYLVRGVECPQLIASSKNEPSSWKPGGDVEKTLRSIPDIGGKCECYVYSSEAHGFFTRGDTKNEVTCKAIEDLLNKSIHFIHKCVTN